MMHDALLKMPELPMKKILFSLNQLMPGHKLRYGNQPD